MSRQAWNSTLERENVKMSIRNLNHLLQYIELRRSLGFIEDDLSSLSVDSSLLLEDSDDSSDSDGEADFDTVRDLLVPIIQQCHEYAQFVYSPIADETIVFGRRLRIDDISDDSCILNFRFRKVYLKRIAEALWPRLSPFLGNNIDSLVLENRYTAPYETCLLVYLYKMARPVRIRPDCEQTFGMRKSHLSVIIRCFGNALFQVSQRYLLDPQLWHGRMEYYSGLVEARTEGLIGNVWGFIDGTIRRTCRPILYQNAMYTRYKRCHGIKFQSVVNADGLMACLHGPFVAKRHDARIYRESGIAELLEDIMPADESNGPVYALYGDLAYPQSNWMLCGYVNPDPDSPQAIFNRRMSSVRIVVEWGFMKVVSLWQHLDCTKSMQVFKQPIAQQYINCAFLTNLHTCLNGNLTSQYFRATPPTLEEYLDMINESNGNDVTIRQTLLELANMQLYDYDFMTMNNRLSTDATPHMCDHS